MSAIDMLHGPPHKIKVSTTITTHYIYIYWSLYNELWLFVLFARVKDSTDIVRTTRVASISYQGTCLLPNWRSLNQVSLVHRCQKRTVRARSSAPEKEAQGRVWKHCSGVVVQHQSVVFWFLFFFYSPAFFFVVLWKRMQKARNEQNPLQGMPNSSKSTPRHLYIYVYNHIYTVSKTEHIIMVSVWVL